MVHISVYAPEWQSPLAQFNLTPKFGALRGARFLGLHARRCVCSPQMRVPWDLAPGWRMHGTEAALLVPIDLSQRAFIFTLNDPGVDAPGRVS
jgi:hypothetical protein